MYRQTADQNLSITRQRIFSISSKCVRRGECVFRGICTSSKRIVRGRGGGSFSSIDSVRKSSASNLDDSSIDLDISSRGLGGSNSRRNYIFLLQRTGNFHFSRRSNYNFKYFFSIRDNI